jgi:peroxiredoxin
MIKAHPNSRFFNAIAGLAAVLTALVPVAHGAPPKDKSKPPSSASPASSPPAASTPAKKPADSPPAATPAADKSAKPAPADTAAKPAAPAEPVVVPEGVPPVLLTKHHANLCRVKVGDALPAIELPTASGNKKTKLSELYGKAATVVVFWADDREMSHMELADLATDVIEPFGSKGVAVVGVAVKEKPETATSAVKEVGKEIPMLVDDKGTAFAQIGSRNLPRTFVLDANGKILWFDIEYSHATRRELKQALAATVH